MDWMLFLTFLAATAAAGATGSMFEPGEWYEDLDKPVWTPPGWAFPVVWVSLYVAMAYAAMRVAVLPGAGQALAFWALQIALNTLWSPVFFGLKRMRAALMVLVAMWLAVGATMVSFFMLDPVAGMLLIPYLVWVSIAGALNYSVLTRNPQFA
ncbi:tryptophan-rich sensory protein [Rhodobacteraceae bacterium 2376]|uniref:Tryptophan-rich sensory protein n=1 Tax=Rhabdonatronobacter sediminivivens TaxID=2743469 RepID=A0A7Z0HW04_9RHOB|nr:TspO/MBR family protein [Rhabdonatronobacter sediminivivens]NYS23424.1 tryptophan-rich sensory protein [Rhabdonatronobacter sediminivivens]